MRIKISVVTFINPDDREDSVNKGGFHRIVMGGGKPPVVFYGQPCGPDAKMIVNLVPWPVCMAIVPWSSLMRLSIEVIFQMSQILFFFREMKHLRSSLCSIDVHRNSFR